MNRIEFIKAHVKLYKKFKKDKKFCSGLEQINKNVPIDIEILVSDFMVTHDYFIVPKKKYKTEITAGFLLLEALEASGFIVMSSTSDAIKIVKFFGFLFEYLENNMKET
jgi:hypothetical protein